jgi:hypothetical protein
MGLLGEIAADAAGLAYSQAMQRDVLSKLGMQDTGVSTNAGGRLAQGFSDGADMPNWGGFDALAGAGALLSTVDDMLQFVDANFDDSRLTLNTVLKRARDAATAFGWHKLVREDGEAIYWHNGGTGGYASFLAIRPDQEEAVVILSTSTAGQRLTELGFAQITGEIAAATQQDLGPYTGSFELAPGFILSVFEKDGRLFGQATGQAAFPLAASGDNEFSLAAAGIRIVFNEAADGFNSIDFHQGGSTTIARRVAAATGPKKYTAIDVEAEDLQSLVGEYQLAPQIIITIIADGEQLYAQLTGQAAFPVFPYESDKFFFKVVDAQLFFERDADGRIDAVILNQNGQQRAPRIP